VILHFIGQDSDVHWPRPRASVSFDFMALYKFYILILSYLVLSQSTWLTFMHAVVCLFVKVSLLQKKIKLVNS